MTINNQLVGNLFSDLPTDLPLWMIIDVYGSTQSVQFVREDNIPPEILARGPEAVEAYVRLRRQGSAPLFRGRVFLLGQDRPSNVRLRKTLLGQPDKPDCIIQCHHWCRVNNKGQWKVDELEDHQQQQQPQKRVIKPLNLEDDYDNAIARNIAIEILKGRQKKKKAGKHGLSRSAQVQMASSTKTAFRSEKCRSKGLNNNKIAPAETSVAFSKLPPNMINLVEGFLKDFGNETGIYYLLFISIFQFQFYIFQRPLQTIRLL